MPAAWLKSKRVWGMVVTVGLLACIYWISALSSTHQARGHVELDPLVGHWACVESFGLLGAAQVDVRLRFSSDRSLTVEMAAKNRLGTSAEGSVAGRGTWQRRANHELLLTVENLSYGLNGSGSGKHARRVKKWCNKLVNLVAVGDRQLVLANLFHSGQEVFTRLPD